MHFQVIFPLFPFCDTGVVRIVPQSFPPFHLNKNYKTALYLPILELLSPPYKQDNIHHPLESETSFERLYLYSLQQSPLLIPSLQPLNMLIFFNFLDTLLSYLPYFNNSNDKKLLQP